jgi:hypothetical protein
MNISTTIKIKWAIKKRLRTLAVHPRETDENIILRLIDTHEGNLQ